MKRQKKIDDIKNKIEKLAIQIQGYQNQITKLESREDIKFELLYKALERIKTIEGGYVNGKIRIDFETIKEELKCTVTCGYEIDSDKQKIIKTFISDLFNIKISLEIIEQTPKN